LIRCHTLFRHDRPCVESTQNERRPKSASCCDYLGDCHRGYVQLLDECLPREEPGLSVLVTSLLLEEGAFVTIDQNVMRPSRWPATFSLPEPSTSQLGLCLDNFFVPSCLIKLLCDILHQDVILPPLSAEHGTGQGMAVCSPINHF
jgi:hypothetical protein